MPRYALFFVAFILMFLTGCGDAVSVAQPTEVVAVVEGGTAVSPTSAPTIFPTSTLAPSATSTHTAIPTDMPTETETATMMPVPTVTPPLMRIVLPSEPEDSEGSGLEIVNQTGVWHWLLPCRINLPIWALGCVSLLLTRLIEKTRTL